MTPSEIEALFTRSDDTYAFARWGRPIAPIVFGVEDETLQLVKGALEAVCLTAGHTMAETDPELGSNLMVFFFRDWSELPAVKDLDQMVPDLAPLVDRLQKADANQYRIFRFDPNEAIRACFVFIRMDDQLADISADVLILGQVVQSMLLWSDQAFRDTSPLGNLEGGKTILKPEIAAVLKAAYDPIMPSSATDPSHALRLSARMGMAQ